MNPTIWRRQFGVVGLLAVILSFAVGCADLNDDPPPANSGSGELTVSLTALAQQLGYRTDPVTGLHTTPTTSAATTPVVTLVIGAMVVRSRTLAQTPYSNEVPITNLETQLETDLLNSIGSLQLVQLPAAQHTVSVTIPGPSSEKWQFLAAGFKAAADGTRPQNLADLGEDKFQDSAIYFAFHPQFLKTTVSGETVTILDAQTGAVVPETAITLTLKRACLNTEPPPKGCAQYDDDPARTPRVTAAVEIVDVLVDGVSQSLNYPLVVIPSGGNSNCAGGFNDTCTAPGAVALLNTINRVGVARVEVRTTHRFAYSTSHPCRIATTLAALLADCAPTQNYITPY